MLRLIALALVTFILLFAGIAACGDDDDDTGGDQANGETAVPDPADGGDDDDDDDGGDDDIVDEGETPSGDLEEYFAAAEVIAIAVDTELDEIGDALDAADPETDEEYIALFQDSYQRGGQALETAWLDMADLTPPSEVEAQHNAFLDSIEGVLILLSGILEDSQEVAAGDELDELFAEYEPDLTAADTELDDACFALQEAGEANGVSADLRCGD